VNSSPETKQGTSNTYALRKLRKDRGYAVFTEMPPPSAWYVAPAHIFQRLTSFLRGLAFRSDGSA
jgi:hypothetical protein